MVHLQVDDIVQGPLHQFLEVCLRHVVLVRRRHIPVEKCFRDAALLYKVVELLEQLAGVYFFELLNEFIICDGVIVVEVDVVEKCLTLDICKPDTQHTRLVLELLERQSLVRVSINNSEHHTQTNIHLPHKTDHAFLGSLEVVVIGEFSFA